MCEGAFMENQATGKNPDLLVDERVSAGWISYLRAWRQMNLDQLKRCTCSR